MEKCIKTNVRFVRCITNILVLTIYEWCTLSDEKRKQNTKLKKKSIVIKMIKFVIANNNF